MTTKKIGRDDKAIAAAKQKAANAQRAKRGLKPLAAKKKQPPKKAATKKSQPQRRRKKATDAWSESEESEEEFEEESEEDEESEEEEEFDVSEEEEEDDDDLVLESDGDSDGPSFLAKSKKQNVKVKPMLAQAAKLKATNKKKGFAASHAPSLKIKTVSRSSTSSSSDEGDDDDVDVDDYLVKDNGPPKRAAAAKKAVVDLNSDLSDDDVDAAPAFKKKSAPPKGVQSKYFQSQSNATNPASDDPFASDSDTPMKPKSNAAAAAAAAVGGRKRAIQLDDDDEDFTPIKATATYETPFSVDDDDDEGFQEDMAAAIKLSKNATGGGRLKKLGKNKGKSSKQNAQKKRKKDKENENGSPLKDGFLLDSDEEQEEVIDVEEEQEIVYKEDEASSSEDENGLEGDEEDEYMDAEAQEASSVLATANDLSASVLRIMASWASDEAGGDENGNGDRKITVPQGMIVDGAISLSKVAESRRSGTNNNKHQQSWISAEAMQEIMPKEITLKEYQLLGVNWLAMLHSMTCKVATDKKPTNVNGVLADEMGKKLFDYVLILFDFVRTLPGSTYAWFLVFQPTNNSRSWENLPNNCFHGVAKRQSGQRNVRRSRKQCLTKKR